MTDQERPKFIAEGEATGRLAAVYDEIRRTLRVNGVNLIFRRLAAFDAFPELWEAVRPVAGTRGFAEAADRLRAESVRLADGLGRLGVADRAGLDEQEAARVRAALAMYHHVNPELLLIASAWRLALLGEPVGGDGGPDGEARQPVEPGVPAGMFPMEMVPAEPDDRRLAALFDDMTRSLDLPAINSDYRTLAFWPGYLGAIWEALRPIALSDAHQRAADALRESSRAEARALPMPLGPIRDRLDAHGETDAIAELVPVFERLIPGLILNVTLVAFDWQTPDELARPPFPAVPRGGDR